MMLRRTLSAGTSPPRLRFRGPNLHVPLRILAAGWVLFGVLRAAWWLARHPRTALVLACLVLAWAGWLRWGWGPYGWACSAAAVHLGVWWAYRPDSFRTAVTWRLLAAWRQVAVYRRDWQPAMVTAGLAHAPQLGASLPRLRTVRYTPEADLLRVRMLPGQTVDAWRAAGDRLAVVFQVRAVRATRDTARPRDVLLTCRRRTVVSPGISTVTKPAPQEDTQPATPAPGAFPRAPRRAS